MCLPKPKSWRWSETEQSKNFVEALCSELNLAKNEVYQTRRGRYDGGTWAHWQIAAAYAQYSTPVKPVSRDEGVKRFRVRQVHEGRKTAE